MKMLFDVANNIALANIHRQTDQLSQSNDIMDSQIFSPNR
jgi:hypothetical protein